MVIDAVGSAIDFYGRATATEALALAYEVRPLTDMRVGVAPETTAQALTEMSKTGIEIIYR